MIFLELAQRRSWFPRPSLLQRLYFIKFVGQLRTFRFKGRKLSIFCRYHIRVFKTLAIYFSSASALEFRHLIFVRLAKPRYFLRVLIAVLVYGFFQLVLIRLNLTGKLRRLCVFAAINQLFNQAENRSGNFSGTHYPVGGRLSAMSEVYNRPVLGVRGTTKETVIGRVIRCALVGDPRHRCPKGDYI